MKYELSASQLIFGAMALMWPLERRLRLWRWVVRDLLVDPSWSDSQATVAASLPLLMRSDLERDPEWRKRLAALHKSSAEYWEWRDAKAAQQKVTPS
jgi:hypothetical protein